ncbi:hypothetical protein HDU88_002609 [Geranomyces variabilis]|nr:hypothetical protein HDU88_002609 [Geranomyces variabilis]
MASPANTEYHCDDCRMHSEALRAHATQAASSADGGFSSKPPVTSDKPVTTVTSNAPQASSIADTRETAQPSAPSHADINKAAESPVLPPRHGEFCADDVNKQPESESAATTAGGVGGSGDEIHAPCRRSGNAQGGIPKRKGTFAKASRYIGVAASKVAGLLPGETGKHGNAAAPAPAASDKVGTRQTTLSTDQQASPKSSLAKLRDEIQQGYKTGRMSDVSAESVAKPAGASGSTGPAASTAVHVGTTGVHEPPAA